MPVTEERDKPLKYPPIFNTADVAVLSEIELAKGMNDFLAIAP